MDIPEKNQAATVEAKPKLAESEIIDLKRLLIENGLLDNVAAAYALECYPRLSRFLENQPAEHHTMIAIDHAAQIGVILGQNVMRPDAEWEEGVPQPEDFLPHARLQDALRRSRLIPDEIASLGPGNYPGEWGEWAAGVRPNPHLSESDIELLQANGYSVFE